MRYLSKILLICILFASIALKAVAIPYMNPANEADTLTPEQLEQKVIALTQQVKDENRLVDILTPDDAVSLPVGIEKKIGGLEFIIVIDDLEFGPDGAVVNAYMTIQFPGSTKNLVFQAKNVSFFPWGFLNGRLQLVTNKPFNIGNLTFTLNPESTFVDFDCMGYKKTSLSAKIEFPDNIMIKEDPSTRQPVPNAKVTSEFTAEFVDINDLLVEISIDPFQLKSLKGFGFYTTEAVIDFSDLRNPDFGSYTQTYINSMKLGEDATLWRGIYLKTFEIKLPNDFNKTSSQQTTIGAEDLLFDDAGFTGSVFATNLLSLDKGSIGGWQFSMDSLELSLMANHFDKFGFAGKIVLPVSKTPTPMTYRAIFDSDSSFLFAVSPPANMNFDLWAADVQIYNNSVITIQKKSGKYSARAELNGKMTINAPGDNSVQLADILFQKMVIQTEAPNFDIMAFSANVGTMSGFPIQVKNISYKKQNQYHGIDLTVAVSLVSSEDNGFSAEGGFTLYGKQSASGGSSSWEFSHLTFNRFAIDISQSFFDFKGDLEIFKKDAVYGNGIKGMLQAKFNPGPSLTALVQFGSVNNYRYWYADAFVTFQNGVALFPGINMFGFGGGAYYHMKQEFNDGVQLSQTPISKFDTTSMGGISLSGVKYTPDNNISFGFKASTLIGTAGNIKAFNAKATFAMEFLSSGGLSKISFNGDALFMSDPGTAKEKAKIYAGIYLEYIAQNKTFWGNLESYINVGDAIKGIGENGRAGEGQLYFGPDNWYIYLGQPTDPIGVKMANMMQADAYFCTGTVVPGIPPPPSEVSGILGDINLDMCRDLNKLHNAGGFAFGASLNVSTGRKQFMIFYGSFDAGVGFDLMLVNYGEGVHCKDQTDPLGINGWYASGQMYAYLQGTIGMHIKMFSVNKDVNILDIGAAAVLQAQLPNPLFMRGEVGGYYSVLGGLVKGNCNFKVEIGEQCEIVGANVLAGITAISDITPKAGTTDVDVFSTPQATFNYEMDKEFELVDENNNTQKYRIKFDYLKLKNQGQNIAGSYNWNSDKTAIAFESTEILPSETNIEAEVKVHFEQNLNGTWQTVKVDGTEAQETLTTKFTTGEAPNYIPVSNIEYCYPVMNQLNFYKSEYPKGYIQLKRGQSYLFDFPADERWYTDARLESTNHVAQTAFTYNSANKKIEFNIPTTLLPEKVYKVELVNIPVNDNATVDENVNNQETILATGDTLTTKIIDGGVRQSIDEETILSYNIRTSKFSSFNDKLNSLIYTYESSYPIVTGITRFYKFFSGNELFGKIEMLGSDRNDPLIQCTFIPTNNKWYNKYIYDLVYKYYPDYGFTLSRAEMPLAIPAVNSIYLVQTTNDYVLDDQVITTGKVNWNSEFKYFSFMTSYSMYQDFMDLRTKAIRTNYNSNQYLYNLVFGDFSSELLNEHYDFEVKYTLPGIHLVTTTRKLNFYYD